MNVTGVVDHIGLQGDGVVTLPSGPVFIPKVLQGETVEIVDGKLKRVVTASPQRVSPFCAHFDTCGGCKFQHWAGSPYAAWKRQTAVDALLKQGLDITVAALIDAHGQGRRRVVLHVRESSGIWQAGFMEAKSHDLTAIMRCPVLVPELLDAAQIAGAFGPVLGACDVSITAATNGLDVAVKAERSAVQRRLPKLQLIFEQLGLLRLSVNNEPILTRTQPFVQMGLAQVPLPLQPFLQATKAGEDAIGDLVTDALKKARYVADLFCGIGPFAFRIAERSRVHAVDVDKPSVASLGQAARQSQGLKPMTSEVRDLFRVPLVAQELNEFDAVVLDPPRAGAEGQCRHIAKSKVRRIVYVSCNAQTFARDAKILVNGGYNLKRLTLIDQFKWTPHVELVGEFRF
jgi:23S rRNA (uracil1939-C5)-methyltransferase